MLSWSRRERAKGLWSHMARTSLGSALIHERPDGQALMDMWRPDQTNIGTGLFPNVDAAKTRAETILDPRTTCWEMVLAEDLLDATGTDD